MNPASGRFFGSLHGLRGLLALWVVVFHREAANSGLLHFVSYGYVSVDLFFCLSGYVLMQTHAAEFRTLGQAAIRRFLLLRWWRTYPVALACLLLAVGVYVVHDGKPPHLRKLLESALLLEGWAKPGLGINVPIWSLGVEWLGYLAFPVIACASWSMAPRAALSLALAIVSTEMLILLVLQDGELGLISGPPTVLRMAAGFSAGCLLWRSHAALVTVGAWRDLTMVTAVAALTTVLLFLPPACAVLPLLAIVHAAARPGPGVNRLLTARPVMFLGRISFALYLCHSPLRKLLIYSGWFEAGWMEVVSVAIFYAGSILLAVGLHGTIEEPLRVFGRRLVGPFKPAVSWIDPPSPSAPTV